MKVEALTLYISATTCPDTIHFGGLLGSRNNELVQKITHPESSRY
jgi:hypothetical protein